MTGRRLLCTAAVLLIVGAAPKAQGGAPTPSSAAFVGTWVFSMSNPEGTEQTVRIVDRNGVLGASLQIGRFPPNEITGVLRDRDVLVLTTTLRENGAPIWAVIALTLDGDTMSMAQMLQRSQTIKRGVGHKQAG